MRKRTKALLLIIAIIIGGLITSKSYNWYLHRMLVDRCEAIKLVMNSEEIYGIHPFLQDNSLVAVIPSSWIIDSIKIYKSGVLKSADLSDKHIINMEGGVKIKLYQSEIASIQINTVSGSMNNINSSTDKSVSESGTMRVVNYDGMVEYDGELKKIKGRGNGTWRQNQKKPYNITLPHKTEILGLKKGKKYCLLANDKDNSHLKNWLAFNIAKELGTEYPVECEHAAVWFNGRYAGLYLVTNKVDISKSSVDIHDLEESTEDVNNIKLKKLPHYNTGGDYSNSWDGFPEVGGTSKGIEGASNPEDISGGYLLDHAGRLFTYASAESGFVTSRKWTVTIKSPKYATREQVDYISGQYEAMDRAITSDDGFDEDGHYYTDFIDLHSFATYFLCQEVLMNHDGGLGSVTVFKPEDEVSTKFHAGPVWDFDVAFHLGANALGNLPNAYVIQGGIKGCPDGYSGLLGEVAKHEDFMDSVKVIYRQQMRPVLDKYLFSEIFDNKRKKIEKDAMFNAYLWNKNVELYSDDCNALIHFMKERIDYIDNDWIDNSYNYTITLNVNWTEAPLPYHIVTMRVKDGEVLSNFPIKVAHYCYDYNSYNGLGWYDSKTGNKFDPTQPITSNMTLVYKWELISNMKKKYKETKIKLGQFVKSLM